VRVIKAVFDRPKAGHVGHAHTGRDVERRDQRDQPSELARGAVDVVCGEQALGLEE
jgi:hypothetical protein